MLTASRPSKHWLFAVVLLMAVAVACSTPDQHGTRDGKEHVGRVASALSTRYEAEDMSWSGVDGEDGIIETNPPPTHRYIWSDSVLSQNHTFVGGSTTITVRAMGELLGGVGPHIVVTAGAVEVGSAYVNETTWTDKTFTFNAPIGAQQIRVTFDNDDANGTEDRNLLVDYVDLNEPDAPPTACSDMTYEAELMPFSGTEGTDGEVSSNPPPTHRYFWLDSSIYEPHTFVAAGDARIRVTAMGEIFNGVGPHMVVKIDGSPIGDTYVNETSYTQKTFDFTATTGSHEVRITYDNDEWVSPGGAGNDRNLLVDKVEVLCGGSDAGAGDAGGSCSPQTCTSASTCVVAQCTANGCQQTPAAAGTSCSDGNACNGDETCDGAGNCVAGTPSSCSSGNSCIVDACDPASGCTHTPAAAGVSCSDGNACNGAETCDGAGSCTAGSPPTVDDGNPCTDDSCDATLGVQHTPSAAGTSCSDANACNGLETCNGSGTCVAGTPPPTDDGNICTVDGCDSATGPTHTPIPNCDPTPVSGENPFEPRASLMGKLVSTSGGAITGATFSVTDAPTTAGGAGTPRSDLSASAGADGSFRIRLTTFRDAEADRTPPLHVILRVDAAGVLPVFRDVWLHAGSAVDLGTIKMMARDPAVTNIGPAGGTAHDSANTIEVVVPAGALATTVPVQITPFPTRDAFTSPLPDSTVTVYGFELEPSGTTFSAPITVRVANTKNVPTTTSIPTGYFDTTMGRWEHVGVATWDGSRFAFQTTHFSAYDCNTIRKGGPMAFAGSGPNPNDHGGCSPPPPQDHGGPAPAPQPSPGPDPCGTIGSGATLHGGALREHFALPTYRVRSEDFGINLAYDSGLAGGRSLGATPTDYQAVDHASHAVAVRGLRFQSICAPLATGTWRASTPTQQPGLCSTTQTTCALGQTTPIPLRVDRSGLGSTTSESISVDSKIQQADYGGFLDLPLQDGKVPSSGLYLTHVTIDAQTPGSCTASGGTFGVSDEQAPGFQSTLQAGPLGAFDYHELVQHRVSSPYGAGWTIQELARMYHAGDVAFVAYGNGTDEKFRPRAYPHFIDNEASAFKLGRDATTGEIFIASDSGIIAVLNPATGARTNVFSGLPFSSGVRGIDVAYVSSARHFVVALDSSLVEVDPTGVATTLTTRPVPALYQEANVAARGDLAFYTDAETNVLYRVRLSDPAHPVEAMSLATGGDVRLFPRSTLSGTTFADPRGLAFGADGTLYMADVRRNAVYAIAPQTNGEVGPDSIVSVAVGDGTSAVLAPLGERYPGAKLAVREPLGLTVADDGTLFIVTAYGAAHYDPLAAEAEWLVLWANTDEILLNPTNISVGVLGLTQNSFLIRNDLNGKRLFRFDIDRLSSEFEPARTLTKRVDGGYDLTDTIGATVERFDTQGRIVERRKRTGELIMGFTYLDSTSDRLASVTDFAGGATTFAYDGSNKLQSITDPRGRTTQISVDGLGDLASFDEPDGEHHAFTYAEHRMTEKRTPRGDLTTYTFRADGTIASATKPEGQVSQVDAALSHPPAFDATTGALTRAGGYTDGHGVSHTVNLNLRGDVERDSYVADGISRVEQAVYASQGNDLYLDVTDISLTNPGTSEPGTERGNRTVLRVSYRTVNDIPLGASYDRFDAHYRPRRLWAAHYAQSVREWFYDASGWLRAERDGSAERTQVFDRDAAGHVTHAFDGTLVPDGNGNFVWVVAGQEKLYAYRADGQVDTTTDQGAGGRVLTTTMSYEPGSTANSLGWTDSVGRSMTFALDAFGRVSQTSDGTATTYATYDAKNRVIETRDALDNVTTYGYAHAGCGCSQDRLVTSIHTPDLPAGVDWEMTYDGDGRLASVTDPQGFTETYEYEATGELKKVHDKLARDTTWTHDQLGRVLSMLDTLGRRHSHTYALPTSTAPGSNNALWTGPTLMSGSADATVPSSSLTAALRNGDYQIGHNAYPIEGYPSGVDLYRDATFALAFSRSFDVARRPLFRVDRVGEAFDSTRPVNVSTTGNFWHWQESWNVFTARPVRQYDEAATPTGAEAGSFQQNDHFEDVSTDGYGGGTEGFGKENFTRDNAGRITQNSRRFHAASATGTTAAYGVLSTYTYRPDGRISQIVNPDGTHDFTYDSRGLVETQTVSGEGTYTYGYDEMGRNSSIAYPDGHSRAQIYDDLGRVTSRCYDYGGGNVRCYTAQYDAVGNPVRMTDPDGVDVLEYDALDRLKKVTRQVSGVDVSVEDYSYNAIGALKVNAGVTLDDQRLALAGGGTADAAVPATIGGQAVTLNNGGFVTSLRGATFDYSERGFLRQITPPIPEVNEFYAYDSSLRRVMRQLGPTDGPAPAPADVDFYVYEGLDRVAVITPRFDGGTGSWTAGDLKEGYLFDGIDHPLRIHIPATNTVAYYELDLAGNVRALRASGGSDLGGYRYSAFGKTIEDTTTVSQPLRWKGRWFSPLVGGTYHVRARQWAPEMGTFLSIDGYRFHDRKSTLWGWGNQNPPRYSDPSGNCPACVAVAIGVAVVVLVSSDTGMKSSGNSERATPDSDPSAFPPVTPRWPPNNDNLRPGPHRVPPTSPCDELAVECLEQCVDANSNGGGVQCMTPEEKVHCSRQARDFWTHCRLQEIQNAGLPSPGQSGPACN